MVREKDKGMTMIDVRSPSEYAESTIPGSVNIPLFDDQERAEIGTLYKRVSVDAAKERGLEIVSAKLPSLSVNLPIYKDPSPCSVGGGHA
ncbi:rhodanese-like domain-containing protein [Paenibacillus sp. D2_2]|uniref:rhodanese-like domain-containing protein n=1 Tax=Paenibacillus sp. D2_2 TaxID=3073092 RepID=UPI0028159CD6|nr:rhodanese-like domain-containing protein [Paenibacillus sp. D2_2]WMT40224.1 rhodanese-like domain-containing protein [Paenibacillus sp. D2_2]